ncbi:MAG: SurA N-terminal domain-containing protein [Thermodesulfovibrionia bacterium]
MLKMMRSNKFFSVFLLGFLTIAITIVFVFWGIGPQQNPSDVIIAEVDKSRISLSEYELAYESAYRRAREVYKTNEEIEKLNLRNRVLDELIDRIVLMNAAKDAGITVSEDEVREVIMNEPAFKKDGIFDKNVYIRRLKLSRMTAGRFESKIMEDLFINKIRRLIGETAELTEIDADFPDMEKDVRDQLIEGFLFAKRERAVKAYVEGLKRSAEIKIN